MTQKTKPLKTKSFEADVSRLLHLMVHSVYSDRDVFLRELISNAADAWLSECLGFACQLVYMPEASRRFSNPDYAGEGRQVGFADGYAYLVTGEFREFTDASHPERVDT